MSGYAVPPAPPPATRGGIAAEIEAELQGQVAPLEGDIAGFERAETRATQDLNALFGSIMPYVAGSAQRVAQQYGATNAAQASIFDQAWQRLNGLRGERASEAQALAQQIGAPVPLEGLFTQALDIERGAFVPEAAGELLKASTIGQAGVQQAEAFAGRVFPLKQARMHREVKNYYRDQITDLKKQITALRGMKPGLINERLRQRQLEDYEMRLARAESLFQREQTKRSLALEERRLELQERELTEVTRSNKAGEALTKRGQNLSAKQREAGNATYVNQQKQNIVSAVNGLAAGSKQPVDRKMAEWRYVDAATGEELQPGTPGGKWELHKWTQTVDVGPNPIRNPNQLLTQTLAALGISKGQKVLYNFAVQQVVRALRAQGLSGIPDDPSKWNSWWKARQRRQQINQGRSTNPRGVPGTNPDYPKR